MFDVDHRTEVTSYQVLPSYEALARSIVTPPIVEKLFKKGSGFRYAVSFEFLLLLDATQETAPLPSALQRECETGDARAFSNLAANQGTLSLTGPARIVPDKNLWSLVDRRTDWFEESNPTRSL
jgi:hypothetical protein